MACIASTLPLVLSACSHFSQLRIPRESHVKSLFLTAPVQVHEEGERKIDYLLQRPTRITVELGQWLANTHPTLLVTVDVLETCHAEGFLHHIVGVVDPYSNELLTPVFHYVADSAKRRILNARKQDLLVYAGRQLWQGGGGPDRSLVIRFTEKEVIVHRPIGNRSPNRFYFYTAGGGFVIRERERVRDERDAAWRTLGTYPQRWDPDKMVFVERLTKE